MHRKQLSLYWWSPSQFSLDMLRELRHNASAWLAAWKMNRRPMQNFGDELSQPIIESLTGRRVKWAAPRDADIVAIGSVLETALRVPRRSPIAVWGSGLRRPSEHTSQVTARNLRVLAVRGHLTADALNLDTASATLGDPGLLASAAFHKGPRSRPTHRVVIPHFTDLRSKESRRALSAMRAEGARVVVPNSSPADVWAEVASAELVLSSALHGLVLADAAGVPCLPAQFSPASSRPEPREKYADYASTLGLPFPEPHPIGRHLTARDVQSAHQRAESARQVVPQIQDRLIKALDHL